MVTGPVCGVVVEPLESVFAMLLPRCRLCFAPMIGSVLAVPPVVAESEDSGGTVTVSVGCGGVEAEGVAAWVSTGGAAGAGWAVTGVTTGGLWTMVRSLGCGLWAGAVGDVLDLGGTAGEDRGGSDAGGGLGADRGGRSGRCGGPGATSGSTGSCSAADGGTGHGRATRGRGPRTCGAGSRGSGSGGCATGSGSSSTSACCTRTGCPATTGSARGGSTAAAEQAAELGEQGALEDEQRARREERGERLGVGAKLGAEGAAGVAALDMAASGAVDLGQSLGGLGELDPDLVTGQLTGLARFGERDAGADQQALHARDGGVHRLGDLLVAHRVDLAQQERRALGLGEMADVLEETAELLAVLDALVGGHPIQVGVGVHRVLPVRGGLTKVVEAAVPRDPVEPRANGDRALVGDHRVVGRDEDLLEHVLRVLGRAEHLPAEAEEAGLVALDERVEGVLVTPPGQGDELLVLLKA